jgi:hypothetical protein
MGASDEEMVLVAGFAGGMGLSDNACGALGAAIWMNTLAWNREAGYKKSSIFSINRGSLQTKEAPRKLRVDGLELVG